MSGNDQQNLCHTAVHTFDGTVRKSSAVFASHCNAYLLGHSHRVFSKIHVTLQSICLKTQSRNHQQRSRHTAIYIFQDMVRRVSAEFTVFRNVARCIIRHDQKICTCQITCCKCLCRLCNIILAPLLHTTTGLYQTPDELASKLVKRSFIDIRLAYGCHDKVAEA